MTFLTIFYKHKRGGFNKRLYRLILALADNGDTVHYVAVEPYPLEHPNIIGHMLKAPFSSSENAIFWVFFLCVAPLFILWIAFQQRADIVIAFSGVYACLCAPIRLLSKTFLLTFLRADILKESIIEKKARSRVRMLLVMERIGLYFSDHIVPNSHTLNSTIRSRCSIKTSWVLPNHIDKDVQINKKKRSQIRAEYGLGSDEFIIVTASPLNRVKNVGFLIRAFSNLRIETAHLLIIGDDIKSTGEKRRLQRISADLNISHRITFAGWIESPFHLIAASDLFIFPSLQEGSPNALLEGLSCNIPSLGSDIPEIREILKYDELLFSLSSPIELSEKISRAIKDPIYFDNLLRLSQSRKKEYIFDWDKRALKFLQEAKGE